MAAAERRHVAAADRYAWDVVNGVIPAGKHVKGACQRHLDDLRRQWDEGFPWRFDVELADRPCRFGELLPHVKGKWGGERLRLEAWQAFIITSIFGWVSKATGTRRFTEAYCEIPRKNGKSALAAVIALYCFADDGEFGAEVYTGATTERQAREVFDPAKKMAEATPAFRARYGVHVGQHNLHIATKNAKFEKLTGKPGDGQSPSCVIVDEYHQHPTDFLYEAMKTGMGARDQPLMFVITTAGFNITGPCYARHLEVAELLDGKAENDRLFGIIYGLDPGDDWTTEGALRKANPNFGVSVNVDKLRTDQLEAIKNTRKRNAFLTKHLNKWVNAREAWMDLEKWNAAADTTLKLEQFAGEDCFGGMDLASKTDVAAIALLFRRWIDELDEHGKPKKVAHYYLFVRSYLPETVVSEVKKPDYSAFALAGHLIPTPGNVTDYDWIEADLVADSKRFRFRELGYDPHNATQLVTHLQEHRIPVIELLQSTRNMNEPMQELDALVRAGRLHHDGNPFLTWMVGNVVTKANAKGHIYPRKERDELKIDGAVAAIMALNRALFHVEEPPPIYAKRGIRTL